MNPKDDPYSRLTYRRLIAWPGRIERERPFLEKLFARPPAPRLLDLGCGSGEHSRFFAEAGFEVVGIDASPSMIEKAREIRLPEAAPGNVRFLLGSLADVETLTDGEFGGAICLGNTLPHVRDAEDLRRAFRGLRRRLAPGAPFCLQILNYEKILATGQRHLPLNFREEPESDGEVVFLRLMTPRQDGTVTFNPTSLRYRPGAEPPVEVIAAKNVELRGWRREELEELLEAAGFRERTLFGGMREEPFVAEESADLVVVAR